ncbi:MAG: hypothetical protein AB2L14_25365 [Candidatus Xenobiia bacterium LiM19]
MEILGTPFYAVYFKQNKVIVTILCYNCREEIEFTAAFQALEEVPHFTPLNRCPHCRQYFVDGDLKGYYIEPYQGKTVERLLKIAESMTCRVPTHDEIREVRIAEERKIIHLPKNLRTHEKSGRKRKKEKKPEKTMGMNIYDISV